MAWIRVPDYEEAEGELRTFWEAHRKRTGGRVANILRIQGLDPAALTAHHALYRAVVHAPSTLTRRERELAAVVVSRVNGCHY